VDLVNPGLNLSLYSNIVPISNSHNILNNQIQQKVEKVPELSSDNDQIGAGMSEEDLIEHSFKHPKKIKIETIKLPKDEKKVKRQVQETEESVPLKKAKFEQKPHKFQFV